ncbi:MAG: ATP-binding protein [Ponticaulis sp.]|nr:ATP-binding protein [Ponticaulis sp.]
MAPSQSGKDDLSARISAAQARQAEKVRSKPQSSHSAGYGVGMKMAFDLLGGAIVGLVFGLAFDHVFGTKPWGLLVLLTLGMVAGFRLMLRSAELQAKRMAQNNDAAEDSSEAAQDGQAK